MEMSTHVFKITYEVLPMLFKVLSKKKKQDDLG